MDILNSNKLEKLIKNYNENKKNNIIKSAVFKTKISELVQQPEKIKQNQNIFSIDIKTMPVTYQKQSGRCWIFAGCNILREEIGKKYNIENFELSQSYIAFYDKLEKCNYFLNIMEELTSIKQTEETEIYKRTLDFILERGIEDGGQWDMFVNIIKKYGIVPKNVFDETFQSSNTEEINIILNRLLRKYASEINNGEIKKLKEKCLEEIFNILTNCYGMPPKKFDFEYKTKNNEYKKIEDITPIEFYKNYIALDLTEYISIINAPSLNKKFDKLYTVKYLKNILEGSPVTYLNLSIEDFKDLVVKQLKEKKLVWFGSDCMKFGDRKIGFWDTQSFNYDNFFSIDLKMSKGNMLDYRESAMNHAMVLTGVNISNNKPNRWKIENSWGEENGYKGYYVASDFWFDEYVYQAVINKKYLSEKQKNILETKPEELEAWDPMGTLAILK